MKLITRLGLLFTALCLVGCSGEGDKSEAPKRLVPARGSEVASSADYKFERTTTTGIKVYVRALTPEMASAIPVDSPDRKYLTTGRNPYLVVPIRDDKIVELSKEESAEVAGFMIERMIAGDPELKKAVGSGGRKQ